MKKEFISAGLDWNSPEDRYNFIKNNPKYATEWKKIPHYWLTDKSGEIYDPTGYIQFINTGLATDLNKSRYISESQTRADGKKSNEGIEEDNSRIARKPGQPANSKKHSDLYTDENPKGTITGLKFATEADARASVSKIRNSGRSHAHKIQAAVAMEQRAKAAGKSEAAAVYRKYINANKKTDEGVDLEEACWDSYKQVGMKKKSGKMVPNCVPKESVSEEKLEEDLRKWFKEKWVRFGPDGKIRGACARGSESEGKPKCLPQKKAHALGKKKRASAASRKRRQDPNPERQGKAKNVATKSTRDKK
jgi:hypothetical protein